MNCIASAATALMIVCAQGTVKPTPQQAVEVWNMSHPAPPPAPEWKAPEGWTDIGSIKGEVFGDFFPFYGVFRGRYSRYGAVGGLRVRPRSGPLTGRSYREYPIGIRGTYRPH